MKAYNLLFGEDATHLTGRPRHPRSHNGRHGPAPDAVRSGWIGDDGPSLGTAWPRSPKSKFPMAHVLSLALPKDYQRRGPGLPAIAFFAGDGERSVSLVSPVADADSDDPFLADLATARTHPQMRSRTGILDDAYALVWLTQEEFDGGPTPPPADPRRLGEWVVGDETGMHAWDHRVPLMTAWLVERDDPNAGITPVGFPREGADYESWMGTDAEKEWAAPLDQLCHLGGTTFHVQGLPDGLSPFYLEIEEIGNVNFGGGNCQIDLESDTFDWSC